MLVQLRPATELGHKWGNSEELHPEMGKFIGNSSRNGDILRKFIVFFVHLEIDERKISTCGGTIFQFFSPLAIFIDLYIHTYHQP